MIYKSAYNNQEEILNAILSLHCPDGFDVDASYGNGSFYSNGIPAPKLKFDIDGTLTGCSEASSTHLPIADSSVDSVVFDPPFLTYVRSNRVGNGNMIMSKRFSGYWSYQDLEDHYRLSLKEFGRILRVGGVVVFKCQDIIHNHKHHPTHINVVNWGVEYGFRLLDLFILVASHRLPSPNRKGTQRHARIFHNYFLVLKRL